MGRLIGFIIYGGVALFLFFVATHTATQGTIIARPWEPPSRGDLMVGIGTVVAFMAISYLDAAPQ